MVFRPISSVLADVMADLRSEMQGSGSSDERAPAPAYPVTGKRVATGHGEGAKPVAFAQVGGGTAAQTENGLPVYIAPRTGKRAGNPRAVSEGAPHSVGRELNGKGTGANPRQLEGQEETAKRAEAERGPTIICIGNSFPGLFDMILPVGREIATVKRRNRSKPHASAVVISLATYRAQRHAIHPIA